MGKVVENYTPAQLREEINNLLKRLDEVYTDEGQLSMHTYGQSPDWFVKAAMMGSNIEGALDEKTT